MVISLTERNNKIQQNREKSSKLFHTNKNEIEKKWTIGEREDVRKNNEKKIDSLHVYNPKAPSVQLSPQPTRTTSWLLQLHYAKLQVPYILLFLD